MSKLREERIEILKNLAKQDGGLITTAQIEKAGISRVLIPTFIEEGVLVKERHGTYYYADEFPDDLLLIKQWRLFIYFSHTVFHPSFDNFHPKRGCLREVAPLLYHFQSMP